MSVSVNQDHFKGREQAYTMISEQGLFARDGAMQSGDLEDIHWHKTSLLIYLLEGSFETLDAASHTLHVASGGDLISIPSRTLHAARCPVPARYVVGFESEQAAMQFRPEEAADL